MDTLKGMVKGKRYGMLVIFPFIAIIGLPEVIKCQSLLDVIISFRNREVVSGTMIPRRTHGKQSLNFYLLF